MHKTCKWGQYTLFPTGRRLSPQPYGERDQQQQDKGGKRFQDGTAVIVVHR